MVFLKFFKWLYNSDEPVLTKRITPPCMVGIKRISKKEKSCYRPSDIWDKKDISVFLKYCPNKRDKCYYSIAFDTSGRPHELWSLRIKGIKFCRTENNKQFVEVRISDGKTGSRIVVLIDSIPFLKEWLLEHPHSTNPDAYIFITKNGCKLTYDGLASRCKYYEKVYFPSIIDENSTIVTDGADKAITRNLVTKKWNIYVLRHSALTKKVNILESKFLSHAGWTAASKMPQVYTSKWRIE